MVLDGDLGGHRDPGSHLQLFAVRVLAGQAHEGDVRLAAGHHEPAGGKDAGLVVLEPGHLPLEPDGFAVILLGLLGDVPVKQGVILILHGHDGGVQIEGQGILNVVELGGAVGVIVNDVDPAVQSPGQLVQGHLVDVGGHAVENHHFRSGELVHHQSAQICVIAENGPGVGKHDLLGQLPVLRHFSVEGLDHLHAVELYDHPGSPMLLGQSSQLLCGDGLLVDHLGVDLLVGVGGGIIFLLALLTDQNQGPFSGVEPGILQSFLDELGFSGVQKAGKGIDGNRHFQPPAYTPNSSAMAASSILEPMTQSRPITSAGP